MYSNKYLKAYLILKDVRQTDVALLLNKSISTVRRKFENLGFTQSDIVLLHDKYDITLEAFFYDETKDKNGFLFNNNK
ncbi:MAG TPA: hypothetical protein DEQ50_00960 [Lactobacillus sp.]|nr:hypothetical protein [Lactobacillus sp.]